MEPLERTLQRMENQIRSRSSNSDFVPTTLNSLEEKARAYNAKRGKLTGYDCPKCLNKGLIAVVEDGEERMQKCGCAEIRRTMKAIDDSGLAPLLQGYTFDRYKANTPLRIQIKRSAEQNAKSDSAWFFIGGQVGFGKTHICTAIVGEMLRRGIPCKYMLWRDVMSELYGARFDDDYYAAVVGRFKRAAVLYIDDLYKGMKSARGGERETMERNATYEILNHRYINGLKTILSSEYTVDELMEMDQAVGSRIYERTRGSAWGITKDIAKNARLNAKVKEA